MDSEKILVHVVSEKYKTLVYSPTELRFVDKLFTTVEDFEKTWDKKLTTAVKMEITFDSVLHVFKKSDTEGYFVKTNARVFSEHHVQFVKKEDQDHFINFLTSTKKYSYSEEPISNKSDRILSLFFLVLIAGFTWFMYHMACEAELGQLVDPEGYTKSDRKERLFNSVVRLLGKPGILICGIGGIAYSLYKNFIVKQPEKIKMIYSPKSF